MLQKDNRTCLLRVFYDDPLTQFHLRELSRMTGVAPPSVKRYMKELIREKLVIVKKDRIYHAPIYQGNRDCEYFLVLKKLDILRRIYESGLLDYLYDACLPDVIILYGSASRGEDTVTSDIDLFLLAPEQELSLETYERSLSRKIHLFFSKNLMNMNPHLVSNIINGIILKGGLDVHVCSDSYQSQKTGGKHKQSLKQQNSSWNAPKRPTKPNTRPSSSRTITKRSENS